MPQQKKLPAEIEQFLHCHHVATLATCGPDGPWAAAVFYVWDGATLYFLSAPTSRHSQHLAHNPAIALAIQDDHDDWQQIKGIQLEGVVTQLSGEEEVRARRLYGERFPMLGLLAKAPPAIVKALAKVRWYKVTPRRLYFVNNAHGLGHRDEVGF